MLSWRQVMDYKQAVNCGELKLTDDLALFVSMAANAFKEINPNTLLQLEEWGSIYVLPKRLPVFFSRFTVVTCFTF